MPHQNHKPLHISKSQLIDESRLLTNATTPNSVYVPGNNQKEPLIIEDDSDDESDDEAEFRVASSDLLASIDNQDASDADCFSKDGQQRLSFAEPDSTFYVQLRRPSPNCSELAETTGHDQIHQGVEKAIVYKMRSSPLRERDGGLCGCSSVCDIENEPRQTSKEVEGSPPSSKFEQEDEQEDDVEATSSDDKGLISYCQEMKESPQHQQVEDETIVDTPLLQVRQRSIKPYHNGDNDDDEDDDEDEDEDDDEDVRPPRRRKQRRIDSDVTETATRKNVYTRSSTIA
ncbi:hypothetical protein VE00_02151 [Pseudogymnoascus sp. WSF 3629]|nr:hypothetical protein VE00_02151 [Pseudogymnoascus sp. WSF 3629]